MSTNAVVCLEYGEGTRPVYFYQHWDGYDVPKIIKAALDRGVGRWNDEPYLARIIFSEMIKDQVMDETGFGISPYPLNSDVPMVTIHLDRCEVERNGETYTYKEFTSFSDSELDELMNL